MKTALERRNLALMSKATISQDVLRSSAVPASQGALNVLLLSLVETCSYTCLSRTNAGGSNKTRKEASKVIEGLRWLGLTGLQIGELGC